MSSATDLSALTELLSLLGDSRQGYRFAASKVQLPELAKFLAGQGKFRAVLRKDLAALIQILRPGPVTLDECGFKGVLHGAWADVQDRFSCWDDAEVLDECERGDRYLLDRYTAILEDRSTPEEAFLTICGQRSLVKKQLASLEQTNDSLLARI